MSKARGVIVLSKYIIIEIPKTGNGRNIKKGTCLYVVTYCLEKFKDIPNGDFCSQSGHFAERE